MYKICMDVARSNSSKRTSLYLESVFHQSSSSSTCPVQLNDKTVNSNYLDKINEIVNLMNFPANESVHHPSQTITTPDNDSGMAHLNEQRMNIIKSRNTIKYFMVLYLSTLVCILHDTSVLSRSLFLNFSYYSTILFDIKPLLPFNNPPNGPLAF